MSSSNSRVPDHVLRTNKLKPEAPSGFVDAYANFEMPLHFDKYNPQTWPEEYAKRQFELGVHPYQQPYNQTYGGANAPGWAHHGGREGTLPVNGHAKDSSTSASHGQLYVNAEPPKGSRTSRKNEADKHSTRPPSYTLVPQANVFSQHAGSIIPSIDFTPTGRESPGIHTERPVCAKHSIENSTDRVLGHVHGEIKIKILWPGYDPSRYPFEKRIGHAGLLSRGELLDAVSGAVVECFEVLEHVHCRIPREQAKWAIGRRGSFTADRFFVVRLHHWGGKDFQPEVWVREEE